MLPQLDRSTIEALRELGLTEYEARVYVSCLDKGSLLLKDLAYAAGVPRTKVYSAAKSLSNKGLVRLRDNPLRCIPVDIEEAFGLTIKQEEKRLKELKSAVAKIKRLREQNLRGQVLVEGRYQIYVAQEALHKLGELISNTQFSLHALVDSNGLAMLQSYRKELAALVLNDCEVRVVVSYKMDEFAEAKIDLPFPIRVGQTIEGKNIFVFDRNTAFLANASTGNAAVINFSDLSSILDVNLFQQLWDTALEMPVYTRIQSHGLAEDLPILVGDGNLLPFLLRAVLSIADDDMLRRLVLEFYERIASSLPSQIFTASPDAALQAWVALIEISLANKGRVRYDDVTKLMTIEIEEVDLNLPDSAWLLALMGYLEKNGMPLKLLHKSQSDHGVIFQAKITKSILT